MRTERYDIIIIGSGAGGGTMAHALADSPARILILERGDFVPQEAENWNPEAVWKHLRYQTKERWIDERGEEFRPYTHYNVGGNTKFWGSVLYRLRREDFQPLEHMEGISPGWPIDYDTLAPYYERAERLYHVHGELGTDPTEPERGTFPHAPIPHAEAMATIVEQLRAQGLHPSPLPLGIRDGCVLCNTCNSFACKVHAKSEADVCCVRPAHRAAERRPVDQRVRAPAAHEPGRRQGRGGGSRDATARRFASRPRWSSCRAARSTPRRCCCDRRTTSIRTGSRIRRGSSAAATWRTWRR